MRALVAIALVVALAGRAGAVEYERFIDVESEEDLYELLAAGEITESTFNTLVELMRRGVDLATASREELYQLPNLSYADVDGIIAYREETGGLSDPAALVAAGVLSADELLSIAPFLLVRVGRPGVPVTGAVRMPALWAVSDHRAPALALQARVAAPADIVAGVAAVMTRNRLGDVSYDPARDALAAEGAATRLAVPKLFVTWRGKHARAIAGSYRIGFGQRLTFDDTDQYTPDGFVLDDAILRETDMTRSCKQSTGELDETPCGGDLRYEYVGPDFTWREGLRGVAVSMPELRAGDGWIRLHGFASLQTHDIYQYELYDRARCVDPTRDSDPLCGSPTVYAVDEEDPLAPAAALSFQTLPAMYTETLAGGNASWFADSRTHVGVTGYASSIDWLVEGIDLDFQEWARTPYGGGFGAVGADASWGIAWLDLFAEVARSFDSTPTGGGLGALLRAVGAWDRHELELTLRWYGEEFANPHARPIAAADERDGLRARDEAGARVRYIGELDDDLGVQAVADFWVEPSSGTPRVELYLRGDHEPLPRLAYALWTTFQDKGLDEGGRGACFEVSTEEDLAGEPIPCSGRKLSWSARASYGPRRWSLTGQGQYAVLDDPRYPTAHRHDLSAYLLGSFRHRSFTFRARARYLLEDVRDDAYLEESLWAYAEAAYRWRAGRSARLRYDLVTFLDDRESTLARQPNPEHWLRLELESRF